MSEYLKPIKYVGFAVIGAIAFQGCLNYAEDRIEEHFDEIGEEFQEVDWSNFFEERDD